MKENTQPASPFDEFVRIVATLETRFGHVIDGQKALKAEIRTLSNTVRGRFDELGTRIDGLGERVHKANNIMTKIVDQTLELHQATQTLERALDFIETQQRAAAQRLELEQREQARSLEHVESRVRHLRDEVADRASDEEEDA